MSKFLQILAFMYHLAEKNPIYFDKAQMACVLLEMLVKILKISFNNKNIIYLLFIVPVFNVILLKQFNCCNCQNWKYCTDIFYAAKNLLSAPEFGPNTEEFIRRFDPKPTKGQGPQRLKNLYFTYLVELRALVKAAPYLEEVLPKSMCFLPLELYSVSSYYNQKNYSPFSQFVS